MAGGERPRCSRDGFLARRARWAGLCDGMARVNASDADWHRCSARHSTGPLAGGLLEQLQGGVFVFGIVYTPPERGLVRAAQARGLHASGGLVMLLYQGAEAFTLWTGRAAPLDLMRAAVV